MANEHDPALQRVLKAHADRTANHAKLCQQVQKNYKAFYGIMEENSKAKKWTNKLAPRLAKQIARGVYANLVDDGPKALVKPRPRMASPDAIQLAVDGARALEILLGYQLDMDRFAEKQHTFIMQDLIAGWTVGKVYWKTEYGTRHNLTRSDDFYFDEYGQPQTRRGYEESDYEDIVFDGPCFEPVRVEDFMWEEGSETLDNAGWVLHRSAEHMRVLEELEKQGIYKNISKLKEDENSSMSDEFNQLQESRTGDKRFKDRVEIWEYWGADGSLITVANQRVVIREDKNPFQHGKYPFVVCSSSPDLFQINGMSTVDDISSIQTGLWSLINQRHDNIDLLNNYVLAIQRSIFDAEQLDELYPGKVIDVEGPVNQSIMQLSPDPTVGRISIEAEEKLLAMMQNTTGGFPFMAGVNAGELDQKTATGVSIVTNIAQKMVIAKKMQFAWAFERIYTLFIENDRQFLRDPVLVGVIGADGAAAYHEIEPESIHGFDYSVDIAASTESLNRQERRAEEQAFAQAMAQLAPIMAAIAQADPTKKTINMEAVVEDLIRAWEKPDINRYFSVRPQPPMQQAPPGANGSMPVPPGAMGNGTSPLASGPMSPSNANTLSPETFMQQFYTQTGRNQ